MSEEVTFEPLGLDDENKLDEMSALATAIVREHYDPILGKEQNDYMLEKFQSAAAIREQIQGGYRYYFVYNGSSAAGFTAFYPRGDAMYLSKLYLKREERGKGISHKMLDFIKEHALQEGLHAVELNVNKYNDSRYIYEKLGFVRIRDEKIDIGSGYFMDDFVYRIEF